jgi:hypothetical protein
MFLDDQRLACEGHHVSVADAEALAIGGRNGYGLHPLSGAGAVGVDHLHRLAAPAPTHDRQVTGA